MAKKNYKVLGTVIGTKEGQRVEIGGQHEITIISDPKAYGLSDDEIQNLMDAGLMEETDDSTNDDNKPATDKSSGTNKPASGAGSK